MVISFLNWTLGMGFFLKSGPLLQLEVRILQNHLNTKNLPATVNFVEKVPLPATHMCIQNKITK